MLGLAFLVRRRQPTLGLVAGGLAVAGLMGLAAAITIDGFAWGVAGELSTNPEVGPDGAAAALKELQESGWSYVYDLAPVGFIDSSPASPQAKPSIVMAAASPRRPAMARAPATSPSVG